MARIFDPLEIGDYGHIYNRGNRKMIVFPDVSDKWHYLKILRYFNDENSSADLFRRIERQPGFDPSHPFEFQWPKDWSPQSPLVKILSYYIADKHIHLFLKEIRKGGISEFMKKSTNGLAGYINLKYNEVGRLFQGSYKRKRVGSETYL